MIISSFPAYDQRRVVQPASALFNLPTYLGELTFCLVRFLPGLPELKSYVPLSNLVDRDEWKSTSDFLNVPKLVCEDLSVLHAAIQYAPVSDPPIEDVTTCLEFFSIMAGEVPAGEGFPLALKVLPKKKGPVWLRFPWLFPPSAPSLNTKSKYVWKTTFPLAGKRSIIAFRVPFVTGLIGSDFDDSHPDNNYVGYFSNYMLNAALNRLDSLATWAISDLLRYLVGNPGNNSPGEHYLPVTDAVERFQNISFYGHARMGFLSQLPKHYLKSFDTRPRFR